jgi:dTDP-glucose 4,6-dehydratase
MRILVTGGAGFIGRHFVRHVLRNTDWNLVVMDRLGEGSDLTSLAPDRISFFWHDLKAPIGRAAFAAGFDYIVHMAAGSHVDRSVKDPLGFVADNVTGTAHMLEFARKCDGLHKFLHFSTDEVFGAAEGHAFDEYESFHATNPYAASKAAAEALCPAWANTYGLPITVTRCTNVAGPGQDGEKFIPSTIRKIRAGEVVQIHARGGVASSRKYIDVEDVCAATLVALRRGGMICGRDTGYYNIGSDMEYSNLDIAHMLAAEVGSAMRFELVENPPNRPRPDMRYDVKTDRLKSLGWEQRVSIQETLKRCVSG